MKKAVILYEKINEKLLRVNIAVFKELWQVIGYEVVELAVSEEVSQDEYRNQIVNMSEDFLITFAMAGFSWQAWMGQVWFNTLAAMQIHILVGHLSFYDVFLQKEYGIQSFFFTDSREIYENWKEKYPLVPYMGYIPTLYMAEYLTEEEKDENRANFQKIIHQVLSFVEKPSVL